MATKDEEESRTLTPTLITNKSENEIPDHSNWNWIVLSKDHKPECEVEKKRILKCGGRVEGLYDKETK